MVSVWWERFSFNKSSVAGRPTTSKNKRHLQPWPSASMGLPGGLGRPDPSRWPPERYFAVGL